MSTTLDTKALQAQHAEIDLLRLFYDEFQKHTKAYKTYQGYSFKVFREEYARAAHVMYTYVAAFGGAYVQAAPLNGISPATGSADPMLPIAMSPELGNGAITPDRLGEADKRRRRSWTRWFSNTKHILMSQNQLDVLLDLPVDHDTPEREAWAGPFPRLVKTAAPVLPYVAAQQSPQKSPQKSPPANPKAAPAKPAASPPQKKEKITVKKSEAYALLDVDGDGSLTLDEMLRIGMSEETFHSMDTDGDNTIDKSEFRAWRRANPDAAKKLIAGFEIQAIAGQNLTGDYVARIEGSKTEPKLMEVAAELKKEKRLGSADMNMLREKFKVKLKALKTKSGSSTKTNSRPKK